MNARTERDLQAAEWLGIRLLERDPDDEAIRRFTARLLESLGRGADAAEHWLALRDRDADDFEAAFHVAKVAANRGLAPEGAAAEAAPHANPTFRSAIAETLSVPEPDVASDFKHIAITGVAYCGSTLLDRMLGGLPDVKSTGESHWITKVRRDDRYCDMSLSAPLESARFVPCTGCGARCEVLTPEFRRSLAADNTNWYRKIAARLGTRILVSADKNLPKLSDKDPLLDLSALVVFKSPEQAWRSRLEKLPADRDDGYYAEECRTYVEVWTRAYQACVDHFRPQGRAAFLNFDAFSHRPDALLRGVCAALELPYDAEVLRRTVPGHAIGGNGRAMRRLRDNDYSVDLSPLPDPDLPPAHNEIIASHAGAQQIWRRMMDRHEQLFRLA